MKKLVWVGVVAILAGSAAAWSFRSAPDPDPRPATRESTRAPAQPPAETNAGTVSLTAGAARRMGLRVTVLKPVRHEQEMQTTAVVLSPTGLAHLSAAYLAETEQLGVDRANLTVARNEYRRQRVLYRADQTTSLKALQAARGALTSSRTQTVAAQRQLRLDALDARQQWGPVLGKWLVARSPAFERILRQQEWLVQVTIGASGLARPPRQIRLVAPSGQTAFGSFLSSFPQTNPVIQGLNFLYKIPARPGLAPGLNLVAEIPVGMVQSGVVVPSAAVVWSGGEAWAYKEIAANRFERFVVATHEPAAGGWFVTQGFAPGNRVVTRAAEELFSVETQAGAGGGVGDD
jgi:hypothetical protein